MLVQFLVSLENFSSEIRNSQPVGIPGAVKTDCIWYEEK